MKINIKNLLIISGLMLLSGCAAFMDDTPLTRQDKQQANTAFAHTPRITGLPFVGTEHFKTGTLETLVITIAPDGKTHVKDEFNIKATITYPNGTVYRGTGEHYVFYDGDFVNPLPILYKDNTLYHLDFRTDGTIYLLDAHKNPKKYRGMPYGGLRTKITH